MKQSDRPLDERKVERIIGLCDTALSRLKLPHGSEATANYREGAANLASQIFNMMDEMDAEDSRMDRSPDPDNEAKDRRMAEESEDRE